MSESASRESSSRVEAAEQRAVQAEQKFETAQRIADEKDREAQRYLKRFITPLCCS